MDRQDIHPPADSSCSPMGHQQGDFGLPEVRWRLQGNESRRKSRGHFPLSATGREAIRTRSKNCGARPASLQLGGCVSPRRAAQGRVNPAELKSPENPKEGLWRWYNQTQPTSGPDPALQQPRLRPETTPGLCCHSYNPAFQGPGNSHRTVSQAQEP